MAAVSLSVNQALDSAPIGAMRWKVWFLSAMGVFLDGFDLFIMAVALPVIAKDLAPDAWMLGLIGAAAPLGAVIGAAGAGRLTDRFGRKLLYVIDMLLRDEYDLCDGAEAVLDREWPREAWSQVADTLAAFMTSQTVVSADA